MEDVARFGGITGRLGVHRGDPECNGKVLRKIRIIWRRWRS
jgi:hypothetical protein